MKKVLTVAMAFFGVIAANAQGGYTSMEDSINGEVFRVCATIFVVLAFMVFILAIIKRILEYRLKNKIVDKGIPENIVSSILQTNTSESGNMNIRWFAILAGLGAGLTIVNYTLPLGIHSLAIMSFCIAISFLGYFFYLKKTGS